MIVHETEHTEPGTKHPVLLPIDGFWSQCLKFFVRALSSWLWLLKTGDFCSPFWRSRLVLSTTTPLGEGPWDGGASCGHFFPVLTAIAVWRFRRFNLFLLYHPIVIFAIVSASIINDRSSAQFGKRYLLSKRYRLCPFRFPWEKKHFLKTVWIVPRWSKVYGADLFIFQMWPN
jgi:hypothetical protein